RGRSVVDWHGLICRTGVNLDETTRRFGVLLTERCKVEWRREKVAGRECLVDDYTLLILRRGRLTFRLCVSRGSVVSVVSVVVAHRLRRGGQRKQTNCCKACKDGDISSKCHGEFSCSLGFGCSIIESCCVSERMRSCQRVSD